MATSSGSLWKVPATGGVPEQLGVGGNNASQPSISRRGSRLAFVQAHTRHRHLGDRYLGFAAQGPITQEGDLILAQGRRPAAFPGRAARLPSSRIGPAVREIWICDRNGANALQLTRFGGQAGTPRWSPDGRSIAFDAEKEGQCDIYVLEVAGGLPRRLTSEASSDVVPSWSGDGRWVYFGSNRTGTSRSGGCPPSAAPPSR